MSHRSCRRRGGEGARRHGERCLCRVVPRLTLNAIARHAAENRYSPRASGLLSWSVSSMMHARTHLPRCEPHARGGGAFMCRCKRQAHACTVDGGRRVRQSPRRCTLVMMDARSWRTLPPPPLPLPAIRSDVIALGMAAPPLAGDNASPYQHHVRPSTVQRKWHRAGSDCYYHWFVGILRPVPGQSWSLSLRYRPHRSHQRARWGWNSSGTFVRCKLPQLWKC